MLSPGPPTTEKAWVKAIPLRSTLYIGTCSPTVVLYRRCRRFRFFFRSGWRRLDDARSHRPAVALLRTSCRLAQAPPRGEVPLFGEVCSPKLASSSTVVRVVTCCFAKSSCHSYCFCGPRLCNDSHICKFLVQLRGTWYSCLGLLIELLVLLGRACCELGEAVQGIPM